MTSHLTQYKFFFVMHRLSILLCLSVLFLGAVIAKAQDTPIFLTDEEKDWKARHQTLRLGVGIAFPPFMWVEKENDQHLFKGMVSDYIDLLGEKLGMDMQIVFGISFNEALALGTVGRIDLFPCIAKTPERSKFLLFTEPYLSYPLVIITQDDAPIIAGVKDLSGKRFATVKHLFVYSRMINNYSDLNINYVFTKQVEENLEAVSLGRADACIINLGVASYYIQKKGLANLRIAAPINWEGVQLSMGVRKDWPILQKILAKGLSSISQAEKDRISQKWIQAKYDPGVPIYKIWRWSLGIGLSVFIIFVLIYAWNRRLRKEIFERQKSESLFAGLYNNMTSGSAIYEVINDGSKGSDYIVKQFNKKSLEIEGKTLDQVVGKTLYDLRPTIDDFGLIPVMKKVWETGKPDVFPIKIYQDEKFSNYYENYIFKIPTGEVVTIYNDVTDQKNTELALRKSEERFSLAIKFANDGLWDWNLETNEIYYSPVWKRLLGYEDHELLNDLSVWEKLTDPEDVKRSWKIQNELINKTRDRFEIEFKMKHKNGHWVDILSRANALFNQEDKAIRLVGTHVDITEKKRAEKEIKRQKEKAERYLNLAGVMFVAIDRKGKVTLINRKGCEVLGYSSSEIIGKNWFENYIPKWFRDDLIPISKQLLNGDIKPVKYHENPILVKNGEERLIAWHNTILKDENGNIIGHLSAGEDITEKRQLEDHLKQAQRMESIGNLAGGIAHEFNNILSIIMGNNELIMEDLPKWSLSRKNSDAIRLAGLRARDIVKQLLTFSRQDDSIRKSIDIGAVVKESVKLIRATTPTNIEIREKISSDCCPIFGDPTQINQVMMNLCNNAIDALPISGGRIDIGLSNSEITHENGISIKPHLQSGEYIKLSVSDNGSGIDAEILKRIFEPYFTTKGIGEGNGIGLAVVHGIIENHGGRISCRSAIGEGTTFTILIPAYEGPLVEELEQPAILHGKGENILYVDDEPSIAELGRLQLESLGYEAFSTTDPAEALDLIKSEPGRFDLVISDMAMPNLPGDQLIAKILSINSKMPTIICSGYSSRMSETKASEMGIKAFVMKPLDRSELAKKVRQILDTQLDN